MSRTSRRSLLRSVLASGLAPVFVPARLLRGQSAPSNRIQLGVIGVGAQGTVDMRAFLNHDDLRVTALCDVNTRNIARARALIAERDGSADVRVYRDFRELNRDSSVDAVLMALPVHWHSIPAADAILNGKHIYHEKPMGMSFEEARVVRAAVRSKGVVFQFGTQQRSDLKFRWAAELALNGRLGNLREIQVAVPGGKTAPFLPEQPVPEHVDWDRWVGPAPMTPFHEEKLRRDNHENMTHFSLGMTSCWGIHHLDIAQWGNGTEATGPLSVVGEATYPGTGSCDAVLGWRVRMEFANAAPVTFVNESREPGGIGHGVRFIGESGWVHVVRGAIRAGDENLLRDPGNKHGVMPVKLPVSTDHTRDFLDAIRNGRRAICDVETAVRSDALCQLTTVALKAGRRVRWDPVREEIVGDPGAATMLAHRPFRGEWKLPAV